ncbi:hypothetical protein PV325_004796 [Microctonus aethiopoides]|nr:hypothetical protein PV325_004796 [Microctonus aethiopoides]
MEREVTDGDGVFSKCMSNNWAELPQTLRRRQKHRPEILNQFTDYLDPSECELRSMNRKPTSMNVRRIVKRSELLHKFEMNNWEKSKIDKKLSITTDDNYHRVNPNFPSMIMKNEYRSLSDEERKTNSPDSLLIKSSDSELSSDEYGHTDDSGAFLESKASKYENMDRSMQVGQRGRFAKLFSRDETCNERISNGKCIITSQQQPNRKSSGCSETRLDMNKNVTRKTTKVDAIHTAVIAPSNQNNDYLQRTDQQRKNITSAYDYENIPRIDMTKIMMSNEQGKLAARGTQRQPTIEELRMEVGCQLRNGRHSSASNENRDEAIKKFCDSTSPTFSSSPSSTNNNNNIINNNNDTNNQSSSSAEEIRLQGFIRDYYNNDQLSGNRANAERKKSKMETITEEKQDGSKLSVREILKRFEELRMQNEVQQHQQVQSEEKSNDKTFTTIQETLQKLDEKVKRSSNQIEQKPQHKAIQHENHVSQITKSIHAPANHGNSHVQHNQIYNQSNHVNRDNNHSPINRMAGHGSPVNQTLLNNHQKNQRNSQHHNNQAQEWRQPPEETSKSPEEGFYESGPVINDGKHSLLQYAMLNFRQSTEKFEMMKTADGSISGSLKVIESLKSKKKGKKNKGQPDGAEWTWKEQVDLVKFSTVPIEQSLLRLDSELSTLAVECFLCLMRYMGDQPLPPDMSEVKCVYTILMHCHKFEALRDEVYCQLMKQTTNNKSPNPDSCQRGWRLFSIVAAYFTCSEGLRPYLIKYLETAAYDKRRAYHGTATVCLQNLRKTVKYGGRKNVPSVEEIMAISAGRNAKRQIYRLPGGTERVINTKCTTVVQDVIEEMCSVISVRNPHEMDEFSLYCIVDGDAFSMPLARDEYVLDVTTELHKNHQVFYLIFCRSVWYYPLRLDTALYIEVVFNQIAPDYLEGLLLVIPGEHLPQEVIYDMAQIAALLHRAADMAHDPSTKEIKYLLPKPALSLREPKPQQWGNLVQQAWNNIQHNTSAVCKAQVLEILSKWPLFGSSFFAVKRVPENGKEKGGDHILALNRHGVHFIDLITHETMYHYPYSEVISTRKVKSEEGSLYLDMKCGNLMQQRITRLQTEQAHEISRLIRQYITMEQRTTNNQTAGMTYGLR